MNAKLNVYLSSSSSSSSSSSVVFKNFFSRFDVGSKNAILLHDIEIGKLFGADFEKIKSIARAETTVAKIHSSTVTLPPLHLVYTR